MKAFAEYHTRFEGDTYGACRSCGGKCEIFKISTLLPGEKCYMSEILGIPEYNLEQQYLDRLDTPYGTVDVLKLKNGCPFLDRTYYCTARPAKPVFCDSYPIIFNIQNNKVRYTIDPHDCPMVHWEPYQECISSFQKDGIQALRKLRIPMEWLKIVQLYDAFDFDYTRIEKEARETEGYQVFSIEHILGFACNGYEKAAWERGLQLLRVRLNRVHRQLLKVTGVHRPKTLEQRAEKKRHIAFLRHDRREKLRVIDEAKNDPALWSDAGGGKYRALVMHLLLSIEKVKEHTEDYVKQWAEY